MSVTLLLFTTSRRVRGTSTFKVLECEISCSNENTLVLLALDHLLELPVGVVGVEVGPLADRACGGTALLARLCDALDLLERVLARRLLAAILLAAFVHAHTTQSEMKITRVQ